MKEPEPIGHPSRGSDAIAASAERAVDRLDVVAIHARHQQELFGFLLHATRDRMAAEDLLQEVFLRLIREDVGGRGPAEVRPWLYRVAANLAASRGRRHSVTARWLRTVTHAEPVDPPEVGYLRDEASDELHRALGRLTQDQRMALLLAGHGFSGAEVARALGRSDGATRVLLFRARVRLREVIEKQEADR